MSILGRLIGVSRPAQPSTLTIRTAVATYLALLCDGAGGEIVPVTHIDRDYEDQRRVYGWPALDSATLLRELEALGCERFLACKVPPSPNLRNLPAPPPSALPARLRSARTVRKFEGKPRDKALAELRSRLDRGETVRSQQTLAEAWNRSEGTVSDWLAEWRRLGYVPRPVKVGRCNVLYPRDAARTDVTMDAKAA